MKRMTITLIMILQFIFISPLLAEQKSDRAESMANLLVMIAKKSLIKEQGDFPIELDEITTLMDIEVKGTDIVYDTQVEMDSEGVTDSLMKELLIESLRDDEAICGNQPFVNIMTKYQLRLVYQYHFEDESEMTIPIGITEVCQ